jgi:hypothetical protein
MFLFHDMTDFFALYGVVRLGSVAWRRSHKRNP